MKKILFSIILVVGLSGCSDFLEPDSPSEYVPETADALNEMLLGEAYPKATTTVLFFVTVAFVTYIYFYCLHLPEPGSVHPPDHLLSYFAFRIFVRPHRRHIHAEKQQVLQLQITSSPVR